MCCLIRNLRHLRFCHPAAAAVAVLSFLAFCTPLVAAVEVEWIMYQDPLLPKPVVERRFQSGLVPLWLRALERPERDLKRRAAATITRGQQKGLPGLDAAIEPLLRELQQPGQDRVIRLTLVQALVALDARQAAPLLCAALDPGDLELAELVEPALARWEYAPMRDVWLDRLSGDVQLRRLHILAICGLTALRETQALPRLLQLAQDRVVPTEVRLEAAAALGKLQSTGLEEPARNLIQDKSPHAIVERLVAARMLESHRSTEAQTLMAALATDPQPAVQAVALGHLFRIDPGLIVPLIDHTLMSTDVNVRRWGADALMARPSAEHIARLALMLDDPDPHLRRDVCEGLIQLAKEASLRDAVVAGGRQSLAAEGWRGEQQAILLLVSLDDKSVVDRLLVLLDSDRPEVHTTAAWGLCRLEVATTAAPICEVFRHQTESWLAGQKPKVGAFVQLSHLAQALGRLRYEPADAVLREYIPKMSVLHPTTRSAALWALGYIHADKPDDELARLLLERALDDDLQIPEDFDVRRMATVSLGRMKSSQALSGLRSIYQRNGLQSALGYASAWAVRELTGEEIPTVEPIVVWEDAWFLTPIEERDDPRSN